MKLKLLPLAISTAIALPGVALADGPTVYGKMNVTYEMADYDYEDNDDDFDRWELNSNASRLGFKGSEDISDNLSVIYQAEYEILVDDGAKQGGGVDHPFSQRDIFIGLKGGWGTFQAGKFDTPLKKSQGKIDQFNDMSDGDISNVIVGENRISNILQYSSPKLADVVSLNVAIQPGEEDCSLNNVTPGVDCDDGAADGFSVSAVFENDVIYAALAMDDGINGDDVTRLTVAGNLGPVELGFLYQMAEESDDTSAADKADEQDGYILSAGFKLGEMGKLRAQIGYSETDDNDTFNGTTDTSQYGLGYDYKLSKQTKLFVNYIALSEEFEDDSPNSAEDTDFTRVQFGIDHKF